MKTRVSVLALCIAGLAMAALAHNGVEHVMGTVKDVSSNSITVETTGKAPKTMTVALVASTQFIKDGATTSAKELKAGDRVVLNVKENKEKPEAVSVVFGKMARGDMSKAMHP
jgi:exosome complex RNA-binding protein Rrp4